MQAWHVTYYYLATGMEGEADFSDYGVVYADTAQEAKLKAARENNPRLRESDIQWVLGCLTATPMATRRR